MEKCFARSYKLTSRNQFSCDISALDLFLGKESLNEASTTDINIHLGLMNVFKIRPALPRHKIVIKRNDKTVMDIDLGKFRFPTKVGELELYNYSNIDTNETLLRNSKMPLITSGISLNVSDNINNLSTTLEGVLKIIEDFLVLTSFIQGCKHIWKFILVESKGHLILIHIRAVKHITPFNFSLDSKVSNFMLAELWQKLPLDSDKKNIALALDWYLESIVNEEFDSKFLLMATSLECLLDAYHKVNKSEFILSESEFSQLEKKIIPEILKTFSVLGIQDEGSEKSETVTNSFKNLRRRTLATKFKLILNQLGIDYSDVGLKPGRIVSIRNAITHGGQLSDINDELKLNKVYNQYKALWSVMIRIFLKLLNYSGNYYDPYLKSLNTVS
jgi:hypothetical protein